jgi:hypothetical protein
VLDFAEAKYEVDESCGTCIVKVVRSGITDKSCSIQFDTSDGDASSTDDYVSPAGTLQFKADETEKEISITIIDDNEWAPDKHFFVRLYGAKAEENSGVEIKVKTATTQVIILNDDDPGSIGFQAKPFHAMDPCPFSCGVLSACFASYVAIVSVDTACNEGCGFSCWLHLHLHAGACACLVFGALWIWGSLGLWGALRPGPGPGGARCEPNQAGVGRGCASLLCGFRGHPLFVIQRGPARAVLQCVVGLRHRAAGGPTARVGLARAGGAGAGRGRSQQQRPIFGLA